MEDIIRSAVISITSLTEVEKKEILQHHLKERDKLILEIPRLQERLIEVQRRIELFEQRTEVTPTDLTTTT